MIDNCLKKRDRREKEEKFRGDLRNKYSGVIKGERDSNGEFNKC